MMSYLPVHVKKRTHIFADFVAEQQQRKFFLNVIT
jgi:hypothetical protein